MAGPPAGVPFVCPKCGGMYEVAMAFEDGRLRGHVPDDAICKERAKARPATRKSNRPIESPAAVKRVWEMTSDERSRKADAIRQKLRREGVTG